MSFVPSMMNEKKERQEFRWPPPEYGRLLSASEAARQIHPPFLHVGSAAELENEGDFPSLMASDVVDGEAKSGNVKKVASGDAKLSTIRRVRFTEVVPIQVNTFTDRIPGTTASSKSMFKVVGHSSDKLCGKALTSKASISWPSAIRMSHQRFAGGINVKTRQSRSVSVSNVERKDRMKEWTRLKNVKPSKVIMNRAAVMRQNHIWNRLRSEWYECQDENSMKPCPFE